MAKSKRKPSFGVTEGDTPAPASDWVYRSGTDAVPPVPPPAEPTVAEASPTGRAAAAQRIVDRYARYSAASGLVIIPVLDAAAITGIQVTMLQALAAHYDVPFSRERGRSLVASLLGGLMPTLAGYQMLKLAGPVAGILSVSGFAVAATHAVGRVFIAHFETGGTLHDVDIAQSRRQISSGVTRR